MKTRILLPICGILPLLMFVISQQGKLKLIFKLIVVLFAVQRVPINIVYDNTYNFLKKGLGKEIKFYISLKPIILFVLGEKINKIQQRKLKIVSQPAQCNFRT